MSRVIRLSLMVVLVAAASGCGRGTNPGPAAGGHGGRLTPGARAAANAIATVEADLVSAVSSAGGAAPVGLKFRVAEPPRVGQPVRIELALNQQAGLDIDSLLVSFQAGDGLAMESERSFDFQSPAAGATQRMVVTVRAQQPGLLNLGATVLVGTPSGSVTRTFSIPLIAVP